MHACFRITVLPDSFGNFTHLQQLDLSSCKLTQLPSNFGGLSDLRVLAVDNCPKALTLNLPVSLTQSSSCVVTRAHHCSWPSRCDLGLLSLQLRCMLLSGHRGCALCYSTESFDDFCRKLLRSSIEL